MAQKQNQQKDITIISLNLSEYLQINQNLN
jgi:hypothetical protein